MLSPFIIINGETNFSFLKPQCFRLASELWPRDQDIAGSLHGSGPLHKSEHKDDIVIMMFMMMITWLMDLSTLHKSLQFDDNKNETKAWISDFLTVCCDRIRGQWDRGRAQV